MCLSKRGRENGNKRNEEELKERRREIERESRKGVCGRAGMYGREWA